MTETVQAPDASSTEGSFGIQRIFLKGASLELPMGANIFRITNPAALNLSLQVATEVLDTAVFETSIRATLTSTVDGKVVSLIEIEQAGIFEAKNLTPEQLADVREISAPTILAPYLRAQLADMLTRATLPGFFMPEINWTQLAHDNRARALEEAKGAVLH